MDPSETDWDDDEWVSVTAPESMGTYRYPGSPCTHIEFQRRIRGSEQRLLGAQRPTESGRIDVHPNREEDSKTDSLSTFQGKQSYR